MSILRYGRDIPSFTKNLRREMEWTQWDLAHQLGVHAQYVSNVERGKMKTYLSFASLLYTICPADRKNYLQDLISDSAATNAVRRLDQRVKLVKKNKRKGGKC